MSAPRKSPSLAPLAARLAALSISPETFAAMTALEPERVAQLVAGDTPSDGEAVRLRVLDQDHPAKLAAAAITGRRTLGRTDAERFGGLPPATAHGSGDAGRLDGTRR
jgi:hypothetical protein